MSLNDVCVFFPAWFGAVATMLVAFLTAECSGSANSAVIAALVMSVVPAHTMRSVAGGYDNESLAVTAMCLTFFVWCRSLRNERSWWIGALAGLAYVYMVAAWGGYTFVLNMVGLHAATLVLVGQYSPSLHRAYSLFWIVGTLGAIQFPVVGLAPVKSLEQLGPAFVFLGMQVLSVAERLVKSGGATGAEAWRIRVNVYAGAAVAACVAIAALAPTGYFGPLSVRVKGLFKMHTRTGNPLVDSVAEHQPGTPDAYWRYLHYSYYVSPLGFVVSAAHYVKTRDASALFLPLYAVTAYYFANRMVRLIIFLGPIASSLTGVGAGYLLDDLIDNARWAQRYLVRDGAEGDDSEDDSSPDDKTTATNGKEKPAPFSPNLAKKAGKKAAKSKGGSQGSVADDFKAKMIEPLVKTYNSKNGRATRSFVCVVLLLWGCSHARPFWDYSQMMARGMSQPSVMFKGTLQDGRTVMVKDYVEAYHWLRDNTPEDSRVMAWWDYGYQIAGMANRTSIADGNTWNHEHIANLARALTAPEEKAHRVIRHLADYVLVWAGGGADDLAKSPHLFRIGKSIGHDTGTVDMYEIQSKFGVDQYGRPTPMMANSLLYKLVSFQGKVSEERFREVYTSKFRKVRIYEVVNVSQKSRQWLADPENRMCDAPGSWYCPGQYPPALAKFTGIIKPAYRMPAFAKQQIEERARREAEKKEAAAQKAAEKKAAEELRKATDGQAAHEDL
uniref:dolichyl-diphosphooligosaccharide--protein glycotransferase n=1 Tax=Micromonas pusilla TaxID=38833 RepID=A0A7S0PSN8_MICPS